MSARHRTWKFGTVEKPGNRASAASFLDWALTDLRMALANLSRAERDDPNCLDDHTRHVLRILIHDVETANQRCWRGRTGAEFSRGRGSGVRQRDNKKRRVINGFSHFQEQ